MYFLIKIINVTTFSDMFGNSIILPDEDLDQIVQAVLLTIIGKCGPGKFGKITLNPLFKYFVAVKIINVFAIPSRKPPQKIKFLPKPNAALMF